MRRCSLFGARSRPRCAHRSSWAHRTPLSATRFSGRSSTSSSLTGVVVEAMGAPLSRREAPPPMSRRARSGPRSGRVCIAHTFSSRTTPGSRRGGGARLEPSASLGRMTAQFERIRGRHVNPSRRERCRKGRAAAWTQLQREGGRAELLGLGQDSSEGTRVSVRRSGHRGRRGAGARGQSSTSLIA